MGLFDIVNTCYDDELREVIVEILGKFEIEVKEDSNIVTYVVNTLPNDILYEVAEWGASDMGVKHMIFDFISDQMKK